MAREAFVNKKGFEEIAIEGDQTAESLAVAIAETSKLSRETEKQGKAVKILVDATNMGALDMGAIKSGVKGVAMAPYDKVAVFGVSATNEPSARFIIDSMGAKEAVRVFENREAAEAWLAE